MKELLPDLYMQTVEYSGKITNPMNLYLLKGEDRSLLVDTGYGVAECRDAIWAMLNQAGVPGYKLDVFITHHHPDHVGLASDLAARGAVILINPAEVNRRFDLLHCYLDKSDIQSEILRTVGVTREDTPDLFEIFHQRNREKMIFDNDDWEFPYTPIEAGEVLRYGGFCLRVIGLRGHTFGQLGLFDREHQLFFCADQVMTTIVPIVGSMYRDCALLECYMDSLAMIKHDYGGCMVLGSHYDVMTDVGKEVDRIVFSYLAIMDNMKLILERGRKPMTVRQVARIAYSVPGNPVSFDELTTYSMILAKTFSCLEYLYLKGFISRNEKNGVLYWSI